MTGRPASGWRRLHQLWLEGTTRPISETIAWSALVANLLFWPGLGGVLLRRLVGVPQMLLSLLGGLTFIQAALQIIVATFDGVTIQELAEPWGRAAIGLGLVGVAWLWSLVSSMLFLREAKSRR